MRLRMIPWAVALLAVITALPAGAQVETVLAGVDVYRSALVERDSIVARHGVRLRDLVRAMSSGDFDAVRAVYEPLMVDVRRPGVAYVDVGFTTSFEQGRNLVYVSIDVVDRADSVARMSFAPAPAGNVADPLDVLAAMDRYTATAMSLVQSRALSPRLDRCPVHHCLLGFEHPDLAPYLELFNRAAAERRDALVDVLRHDSVASKRAAAIFVLAHMQDAAQLVELIAPSIRDRNSTVRNNALRVLMYLTISQPALLLPIPSILQRLDDPSSAVRNKAAEITAVLAQRPQHRAAILQHADVVLRLLRLQQANQHDPAYNILRVLSGQEHGERDYAAWESWLSRQRRTRFDL